MNKKAKNWLVVIFLLGLFLRFYKLNSIPPALSWDEVSLGYNAYSILKTGRDEHGKILPLVAFEAYGDYKPPAYIYATVPFVALFGLNEFSVRAVSALSGALTVLLTYFLAKLLLGDKRNSAFQTEVIPLLASTLLAISPWHLNLSRAGFEANLALFLIVLGAWLFLKATAGKSYFLLPSFLSFLLSAYSFNSARVVAPLLLLVFLFFWRQQLWSKRKWLLVAVVVTLILSWPLFRHLRSPEGRLRFKEVNIFTSLEPIEIANNRIAVDNNVWWSKLIHNRRLLFGLEMVRHYFDNLNMNFLFINGDGNPKFSIRDVGQLYLWSLPFLVIGFFALIREKRGRWFLVPLWLLIGILPASVARETPHALRTENSLPMWEIITAYGFVTVFSWFKKDISRRIFLTVAILLLIVNLSYYLHNYYRNYPAEFAPEWQWGYKQALSYTKDIEKNYDKVLVTNTIGRPYMYVLFYRAYSPRDYFATVNRTGDAFGFFTVHSFGRYVFEETLTETSGKILHIENPSSVPAGAHVLSEIKYPNGQAALVIYD